MTTTTPSSSSLALVPVGHTERLGGLRNLLRKEFGQWWTTRLWWIQVLIWVVILNGISTVIMLDTAGMTARAVTGQAVETFLQVAATSIAIGVVLTVQGSIVGEKELGTAAWVMSKPVSRASFVLAKLVAHWVSLVVTAVLIPATIFAVEAGYLLSEGISYGPFLVGLAVVALIVLFYVALTLALGCLFAGRGPVAGIGIGFILVGQFFKGMLPLPVVLATPWPLGEVASSFALGTIPEWNRLIPLSVTTVVAVALLAVAIWSFNREEF